jgi:hypothetical protein
LCLWTSCGRRDDPASQHLTEQGDLNMGDYGHVTAWSSIRAGREKQALALWADAIDLYEKAKANGLIDEYETQLFQPTGGALPVGIITLWGSQDQVDAMDRNADRQALQTRAGLILEGLVQTRSIRGAAVFEGIGTFQQAIDAL